MYAKRKVVIGSIGLAMGLSVAMVSAASAHHAFAAEFDANKPIRLEGTIAMMEWINPHSWIHLDVANPDGSVTRWMIEGGPPNALFRRGFTEDSLPPGTDIIVEGFQARDGSAKANGRNVMMADGSNPFAGSFSSEPTR